MFFARSDWPPKLGIVSVIHLPAFFWISQIFHDFLEKYGLLGAGYPLVWYLLKQLFTSVLVKIDRYFPRYFVARQMSTIILLHFDE